MQYAYADDQSQIKSPADLYQSRSTHRAQGLFWPGLSQLVCRWPGVACVVGAGLAGQGAVGNAHQALRGVLAKLASTTPTARCDLQVWESQQHTCGPLITLATKDVHRLPTMSATATLDAGRWKECWQHSTPVGFDQAAVIACIMVLACCPDESNSIDNCDCICWIRLPYRPNTHSLQLQLQEGDTMHTHTMGQTTYTAALTNTVLQCTLLQCKLLHTAG